MTYRLRESSLSVAVAAAATAIVLALAVRRYHRQSRLPLPPGPPLEPIIGSLRSIPSTYQWVTFADWRKRWGDVIYTSIFGRDIIILNSIEATRDFLDKRSSNYSDRPDSVVWNELLEWDTILSMPYGDRFRKHRRLISQVLNSQAISDYRELQVNNTKGLIKSLLHEPEKFEHHILRQAYTTIVRVTYGLNVASDDDELISIFAETLHRIVLEGVPGVAPLDLFPFLKHVPSWFPGGGFRTRLAETRSYIRKMKNIPFERTRAERRAGTAKVSLVGKLLDDYDVSGAVDLGHEHDLRMVGAVMYAGKSDLHWNSVQTELTSSADTSAGVETTATTMMTFFQMMAKHTEVVKRAHIEIDRVTHKGRLPTLDDRKDLPIIDCIMKEVLRINAPVPICIPHSSLEEDTYENMRIPARVAMLPNIWLMMRDPKFFPNPDVFDPERFREKVERLEGNSLQVLNGLDNDDPSAIAFGFGRRICPGRYFVNESLWLMMSNILSVFDIGPPLDSSGKPLVIGEIKFTGDGTSRPLPFECTIRPRDQECETLIQELEIEKDL